MMEEQKKKNDEFPGNSYTNIKPRPQDVPKPPDKKDGTKKGRVTEKKKTIGERIADNFLATDKEEIQEHVLFDFIIPGIKTIIEDIVHMILYGGDGDSRIRRDRGESRPRYVSYDRKYEDRRSRDEYVPHRASRHPELIFNRRSDAEQVLSGMCEYIDDYGKATLKDFYNVVFEVTDGDIDVPTDYTMTRYGWRNLAQASVVKVRDRGRDGYLLRMPKAEVI